MQKMLANAKVFHGGQFRFMNVIVDGDRILDVSFDGVSGFDGEVLNLSDKVLIPGLADVHVHLREPGFFMKETIRGGTLAAAKGGYTVVCAMPNVSPAPDSRENLEKQLEIIRRDALIRVFPLGCITRGQRGGGELADYRELMGDVAAFSDDGRGVQSRETMRQAMREIHALGGVIFAHCEDNTLLSGGCIHAGEYARTNGHRGISSESEWRQVARDIDLVRETGCRYHICHISTKETVDLLRRAKWEGLPVSGETAPHYLTLTDADLQEDGRFKMNPPIRSAADRDALIGGLLDGTIDVIATDHAPHTAEEKSGGLEKSLMGVVGLETAFPVLYTKLVMTGIMPLEMLVEKMAVAPKRLFQLGDTEIAPGQKADFACFDLNAEYDIDPRSFAGKGRATPFEGMHVYSKNTMTMMDGRIVWQENLREK